jgi:hypothetical protein
MLSIFTLKIRKIVVILVTNMFLYGCVAGGTNSTLSSTNRFTSETPSQALSLSLPLEINIVELDPGIPSKASEYEKEGVWPELRRAESRKFSNDLKASLSRTNTFGGVYITPNERYLSDIAIKGKIIKSNGEDLHLQITATDSTGSRLINKKLYKHRTNEAFYKNLRNKNKDPFDSLFDNISNDLIKSLKRKDLYNIQLITELRFAREMDMENFQDSVSEKNNIVSTNFIPDANDPLFLRTKNIRSKDLLFRDNMQSTYDEFIKEMDESYDIWQKASFSAAVKERKAKNAATLKGLAGAALMIAGAVAMADSGSGYNYNPGAYSSGFVGALAGAALFDQAIADNQKAKIHKETINEVSESFDGKIAPKVIELEGKTVTLDGNLSQQFMKWQLLLKDIYVEENSVIKDISIL